MGRGECNPQNTASNNKSIFENITNVFLMRPMTCATNTNDNAEYQIPILIPNSNSNINFKQNTNNNTNANVNMSSLFGFLVLGPLSWRLSPVLDHLPWVAWRGSGVLGHLFRSSVLGYLLPWTAPEFMMGAPKIIIINKVCEYYSFCEKM